jgi:hypothetical protein
MSRKPVYMAGQGFMSDAPPPTRPRLPRRLALILAILLPAALWFGRGALPGDGDNPLRVEVDSTPAGAEILLDLRPTGQLTPASLDLPDRGEHLVQARLAGHVATPLSVRVGGDGTPERITFVLEPLPPGRLEESSPAPADAPPPQAAATTLPAVGLAPLLETSRRPPSGVAERPADPLGLRFLNWDPSFRLKVDGRPLDPQAARHLAGGTHRIVVEGAGRTLLDTLLAEGGPALLALPGRERFLEVRVEPEQGEIVAGDRLLGRGRALVWRGDLPLAIRFPALPGLLPPAGRTLAQGGADVAVRHQVALRLQWTTTAEDGLTLGSLGYRMPGQPFTDDEKRGPRREGTGLLLGRAFHDRRPGGAQAARLRFRLPEGVHGGWNAQLEIEARDSGRRFPLVLSKGARLSLWLNGTLLARDQVLDETAETRSWPVGNLLRPGINEVEISSSEEARSATQLSRVTVKVGP